MLEYFFLLMFCHALADFGLQTEFVGKYKNRHNAHELPKRQKLNEVWLYCLIFHSFIHGGLIYLVTGSVALGVLETCLHWMIDTAKCEGWIDVHVDQWLHIFCKAAYVAMMWYGVI